MLQWEVYEGLHPDGAKQQVPAAVPCLQGTVYFICYFLLSLKKPSAPSPLLQLVPDLLIFTPRWKKKKKKLSSTFYGNGLQQHTLVVVGWTLDTCTTFLSAFTGRRITQAIKITASTFLLLKSAFENWHQGILWLLSFIIFARFTAPEGWFPWCLVLHSYPYLIIKFPWLWSSDQSKLLHWLYLKDAPFPYRGYEVLISYKKRKALSHRKQRADEMGLP